MTRSEEALQRRAKKRNLSVEDMKQVEASSFLKKNKVESKIETLKPVTSSPATPTRAATTTITTDRWVCTACNNNNLSRISTTQCNRCQRLRSEVPAPPRVPNENSIIDESVNKLKPKEISEKPPVKEQPIKKKKKDPKPEKLPPVWDCPPATQALIDENMKLRKLYEDEETRTQLSPEDLERARILVQRSERKKQKKEKRSSKPRRNPAARAPVQRRKGA
jgi:hypothetical protein